MASRPLTAPDTISSIPALSDAARTLADALLKLHQKVNPVANVCFDRLALEVKSLGHECDLLHAELHQTIDRSEPGPASSHGIDGRFWDCIVSQVGDVDRTLQELDSFIKTVKAEKKNPNSQHHQRPNAERYRVAASKLRAQVTSNNAGLHTTLLLLNLVLAYVAPGRIDRGLVKSIERLQGGIDELQDSTDAMSQSRTSDTHANLLQYAYEVIGKGKTIYEASLRAESAISIPGTMNSTQYAKISDVTPTQAGPYEISNSVIVREHAEPYREVVDTSGDDSDNDWEIDLAKAALEEGTKAFEASEWSEADSLLQEALRGLEQVHRRHRAFCDIFDLQYKLAICAYHTQEMSDSEQALLGVVQLATSTDEERTHVYNAAHLLSLLYIRMGQLDLAKTECEKTLQARRRLLGKQSEAALESTALMAHIYVLLNNRARARSCLAMIPETQRATIVKAIEVSLGANIEQFDSPTPLTPSTSEGSDPLINGFTRLSPSPLATPMDTRCYGPVSAFFPQSPSTSLRQFNQQLPRGRNLNDDVQSVTLTSMSTEETPNISKISLLGHESSNVSLQSRTPDLPPINSTKTRKSHENTNGPPLTRKQILENVGCQPRDDIEEAVCNSDHITFANLLQKDKGFWRAKVRKRTRPERVTALHFAALFGEIDMARRLLSSNYNVNEVPYGYSTSLTPLKFAIGARQVDTVDFLISAGAKPTEPDSWSTLASQLMNRSWMKKTMSESDKSDAPRRIIAILDILIKHGLDVNRSFDASGTTILHQAVAFWTGSYSWDLDLRTAVTSFLCVRGANPHLANKERKTPYDMALASGHQDLLAIIDQKSRRPGQNEWATNPVELPV